MTSSTVTTATDHAMSYAAGSSGLLTVAGML
jgi:hypothetical protein